MAEDTNVETVTGGDKGGADDSTRLSFLPTELRSHEAFKDISNVNDIYKGFADMSVKSKGMVAIPGENSSAEEKETYRKALGIPDKPEGYEIKRPDKMPEGMTYDELLENNFRKTAHEIGLTPTQASKLIEMFNGHQIDMYSGVEKFIAENKQKAEDALKNIWKGDAFKENTEKTLRVFKETLTKLDPPKELGGIEGIAKEFTESGFSYNPSIVWYMSKVFDVISPDSFGLPSQPPGGQTKEPGMLEFNMAPK